MLTTIALAAIFAVAQAPTPDRTPMPKSEARKAAGAIKPQPPAAIPDDPPPHEGAMIDVPYLIEPPDILVVELVEAIPGRPITGERLVRPDGTISLGFYGTVHVRGLTPDQAKIKVVHHMRDVLTDEALGLIQIGFESEKTEPLPKPGTRIRRVGPTAPDAEPELPMPPASVPGEESPKPHPRIPSDPPRPSASSTSHSRPKARLARATNQPAQIPPRGGPTFEFAVDPLETLRVFVDVTAYNSKVYYVQGDVGTPGRLPVTGKETVLDALNYAGGLIPTAEPFDIHLYRPGRGGKPTKDYAIDLTAIRKGDARANLQVFADDRLVVGRNPTVQKTIELDRAAAPINSVFNTILQQSFTSRSLGAASEVMNGTTKAQRDAMVKEWADFLWSVSAKEGGALLDEKAFREAVMKRLSPPPADPKP